MAKSKTAGDRKKSTPETLDLSNLQKLFDYLYSKKPEDTKPGIIGHVQSLIDASGLGEKYHFLFLYDDRGRIDRYTSNQIYSALSGSLSEKKRDILLILYSLGGRVQPAYLISKCCREYCDSKFIVAVPRQAKSAATLLSVGADEIHMGLMSELGPIDPQIGKYPALGLGNAVEYLASLCKRHPDASDMLAKFLALSLSLQDLGYFERVSESAMQYAERMLKAKKLPSGETPSTVAYRLVYHYSDHSFAIDREEAESFLGTDFVKYDTPEYKVADEIHKFLEWVTMGLMAFKKTAFSVVGNLETGIKLIEQKE